MDLYKPLGCGGDSSDIVNHMLLANPSDRDDAPSGKPECDTEYSLTLEDALAVMTESSMTKVPEQLLGGVEPFVDLDVVLPHPAPLLH